VPIYAFDALAPDQAIEGPAVIESATTSVLLRLGDRARTTAFGWLDIQVA
jgi:N-methylhydantoinase A